MSDRAVFVDFHAHVLHGPRQTTDQLRRVNGRDMGGEDAAVGLGHADLLGQLLGTEPAVVVIGKALGVQLAQVITQNGFLLWVARGTIKHPALTVIAVDAFAFEDDLHFIGNAVQQIERRPALQRR